MYVAIVFTVLWNLVSLPAIVMGFPSIWHKHGAFALLLLLFPAVGIALLYWVFKLVMEWRRFGKTPLTLDPYPGSIGGDVAGIIQTSMGYNSNRVCRVTLSCIRSTTTGTGKHRSTHENVLWQDEGYAKAFPSANGTDFQFRFSVPKDLPAADLTSSAKYVLWRLNVAMDLPGSDLDRDFELPVFPTEEKSHKIHFLSSEELPAGVNPVTAETLLPIEKRGNDIYLFYPMFRKPARQIPLLLIGLTFFIVSFFLWQEAFSDGGILYIMAPIFSLTSGILLLISTYLLFNSLYVRITDTEIGTIRKLFGFTISRRSLQYSDNIDISSKKTLQQNTASKHHVDYSIIAKAKYQKITIAEGLNSASKLKTAINFFENEITRRMI